MPSNARCANSRIAARLRATKASCRSRSRPVSGPPPSRVANLRPRPPGAGSIRPPAHGLAIDNGSCRPHTNAVLASPSGAGQPPDQGAGSRINVTACKARAPRPLSPLTVQGNVRSCPRMPRSCGFSCDVRHGAGQQQRPPMAAMAALALCVAWRSNLVRKAVPPAPATSPAIQTFHRGQRQNWAGAYAETDKRCPAAASDKNIAVPARNRPERRAVSRKQVFLVAFFFSCAGRVIAVGSSPSSLASRTRR